ncbi:hypothetical protein [Streptosporangium sp. NPDC051022]|uniref:hypothetical protein n=1 Tax=Streptosporangium sp. NPDC051022 TaxID=3155752 RepID=UPI0034467C09
MRIRSLFPVIALVGGLALLCQPARAAVPDARQDAVVLTDIVEYRCGVTGETGETEKQDIRVKVELTMPADAVVGRQTTIGWHGVYADDTAVLRVPETGLADGTKLYAYASISGLSGLNSATGVGELAALDPGQVVSLPTTAVSLKTTASKAAGTATVRPAAINFGTGSTGPSIRCEVLNTGALTTYALTVASADGRPIDSAPVTPVPQPTSTVTAAPTVTATATVTAQMADAGAVTPSSQRARALTTTVVGSSTGGNGKVIETPSGGASTGGGGEAGPDGRMFISTGFLLILAAATGLWLRRRGLPG